MKLSLKGLKTLFQNKRVYPTILLVTIDVVALGLLIYFGLRINTLYNEMISNQNQVQEMRATVNLIRNNRNLFENDTEQYNEILEKLIPDQESYFLVISALDQLSERTGVVIDSYSVNLNSSTEEKLTLTVNVVGTPEAIQKFIQEYKFVSGRLITSEKIEISQDNLESMTFSLNFFHNEFRDTVGLDSRVTQEDLDRLLEIGEQL